MSINSHTKIHSPRSTIHCWDAGRRTLPVDNLENAPNTYQQWLAEQELKCKYNELYLY